MSIPKARHESRRTTAGSTSLFVPALASLKVAAVHLGASSANALRMRFDRGIYPKRFLVHLTPNKLGVDLHAILAWIRWGSRDHEDFSGLTPDPQK